MDHGRLYDLESRTRIGPIQFHGANLRKLKIGICNKIDIVQAEPQVRRRSSPVVELPQSVGPAWRQMQNQTRGRFLLLSVITAITILSGTSNLVAQNTNRPWMNSALSPAERADLVLKQLTLDEKLALLHGNGMPHAPQWQMPLTHLANGGAGYVEG